MHDKSNQLRRGEEVLVEIERILPGGVGLAHAEGLTLFVALSAPGDNVRVRIDQIRGKVAFATILEIIEPSPARVSPQCVYFGRCGGCDFQQLTYKAQLAAKVEIIRDCFRRIARVDLPLDLSVVPSPDAWHYRSRAQWKQDPLKRHLGYFEHGSHTVCDVVECPILVPVLQEALITLRERLREGTLTQDVVEFEAAAGDDGVSIFPPFEFSETREVSSRIGGDRYVFSGDSFFQINHQLLPALIDAAVNQAHGGMALDLYCGAGLFSLPLSRRFTRVVGVEAHPSAVSYARRNLAEANQGNVVIECATVGDWLHDNAEAIAPVDFVLLDPPRSGAEKGAIEGILAARPRQISYVSCDPATLARDLRGLIEGGYMLDSIAAFDMFPQTHHVETFVQLSDSSGLERKPTGAQASSLAMSAKREKCVSD